MRGTKRAYRLCLVLLTVFCLFFRSCDDAHTVASPTAFLTCKAVHLHLQASALCREFRPLVQTLRHSCTSSRAHGDPAGQQWLEAAIDSDRSSRRLALFRLWGAQVAISASGVAPANGASISVADQPPAIVLEGSKKAMPAIGFGTCCREQVKGQPIIQAAKSYLANGGRLIDTAQLYENHKDLAVAIRDSGIPRDDVWVTSKILVCGDPKFCSVSRDQVVKAVDRSAQELGLDYLDLMLLHGAEGWGVGPDEDVDLWKGLIESKKAGKVSNIGVSNHNRAEIERLVAATGVKPAVNQIEFHPWVPEETKELVKWCKGQGIAVTAYGSLGGAGNKAAGAVVEEIAQKRGATKAQVLLRWGLDQGVAVIPGSNNEKHIKENLQLSKVFLDDADARTLESGARPRRFRAWKSCKSGCAAA